MADTRKDCCRLEENLGAPETDAPDRWFRRCRVCQCRHFVLKVDPGRIGIRGNALGVRKAEVSHGYTDTLGGKA